MISSTKMTTEGSKGVGKVGCKSKTGPTGGSMQPLSMGPTTKKNTESVKISSGSSDRLFMTGFLCKPVRRRCDEDE